MRTTCKATSLCGMVQLVLLLLTHATVDKVAAQEIEHKSSQGVTLVAQSLTALTHGTAVTDVQLRGTVGFTSGSEAETGPATLEASGAFESRVDFSLSGGGLLFIQNGTQATWSGPNGQTHLQALHNSLNWASWFFPALAVGGLVRDQSFIVTYVGQETYAGSAVQHLRATRQIPSQSDAATATLLLGLTTSDLYLDASSLLPLALEYAVHPDNNALQNTPVTVEFANYQTAGGVQTPFRIRQFLQGGLLFDVTLTSVAINPGLLPSDFQIQ